MAVQPDRPVWIRLELIPLPALETHYQSMVLWWNPDDRRLLGEGTEQVMELVERALEQKVLQGSRFNHFEITDPLSKPSELAAVLAQHFWVIPEPVQAPDEEVIDSSGNPSVQ